MVNLVRVFKSIISAISGAILALKETNDFPERDDPVVKEFDKQYKVYKIVEAEIHKEGDKKFGSSSVTKLATAEQEIQAEK